MVFILKSTYQDSYKEKMKYMATTGMLAALITLMTAYICHVPVGINGGYIHLGDAIIYLAAAILPRPYALAAAAIGGGLADVLTAPMWAPATIVIKMLIVLPFTNKGAGVINKRNVAATLAAYLISGVGYYVAERLMFEAGALFWVSMAQAALQAFGSGVVFVMLGVALDKAKIKRRIQ